MAQVKDVKFKPKEPVITAAPTVDMNILEYLYVAPYKDVINDDKLMDFICNNGYYKRAFCEAHQIESMIVIDSNKKEWKFNALSTNAYTTLDVFQGKTKVLLVNVKIIDSSKIPKEDIVQEEKVEEWKSDITSTE